MKFSANLKETLRFLLTEEEDYRGLHRAPDKSDAPLWNLDTVYPADIYTLPPQVAARYYGHADPPNDFGMIMIMRKAHNRPKAKIRIYRAVPKIKSVDEKIQELEAEKKFILKTGKLPKSAPGHMTPSAYYERIHNTLEYLRTQEKKEGPNQIKTINPGDWVTPWRPYAVEHGKSSLRGEYRVLSRLVSAQELFTDGNSIYEFGWIP